MATSRTAPGGKATVVLGDDSLNYVTDSGALGEGSAAAVAGMEARVRQAPGGTTSIALGGDADKRLTAGELLARPSPGGAASIDLSADKAAPAMATRGPPGGQTTIILGSNSASLSTNSSAHGVGCADAAAAAVPRVRSAPGGKTSVNFGAEHEATSVEDLLSRQVPGGVDSVSFAPGAPEATPVRGPVGGQTTVFLGKDTSDWSTSKSIHGVGSVEAIMATPAKARPAPGGEASIDFAASTSASGFNTKHGRQAPGGTSTLVLGGGVDDVAPAQMSSNRFADGRSQNNGNFMTDRPSTKLHQAPGGTSSIVLGGDSEDVQPMQSSNAFATGSDPNAGNVISGKPSIQLQQAPGGNSSIVLGGDTEEVIVTRDSSNKFANGSCQNTGNVLSERPTTKLHQAPGGNSTIVLGCNEELSTDKPSVQVQQSSNKFANGSNQNAGNVLTDRSSTKLFQAPGGTSSIVLGVDVDEIIQTKQPCSKEDDQERTGTKSNGTGAAGGLDGKQSSNRFASGSSQNTGNFITDRPTTKLHQAPGGRSTICLGTDSNAITMEKKVLIQDENVDANKQVVSANAPAVVLG